MKPRDAALSEKLQLDSKLTLEKAVTKARQAETVRQQQPVVRGDEMKPEAPIGAVHHGKGGRKKAPQGPRWRGATTQRRNPSQPMCYRCGHTPAHDRQQQRTRCATSAENEDTLSKYANPPKFHGWESETESESTEDNAFLETVGQGDTDLWVTKARVNGIFIGSKLTLTASLIKKFCNKMH